MYAVTVPGIPPSPASPANAEQSAIFRTLANPLPRRIPRPPTSPPTTGGRPWFSGHPANPLRRRILSHLQQHREANSTSLARALGESTGTTSYHLRRLAEQGFVEEIPEKSGGRERWWRALPFHIQAPDPAKMAAAEWSA